MSDGFWSLRNAPKWWFDKRAWVGIAIMVVIGLVARSYYGPQRVPANQVVFYGAAWCPYSQALRDHLDASGIPYIERNVEDSFDNFMRFSWAAGRGASLPVVQVGPKVVAKGYFRQEIDAALKDAGYKPAEGASGPEGASPRR